MKKGTGVLRGIVLAALAVFVAHGCGGSSSEDEEFNFDHPYPGFRGQEFKGEKNFATLINQYAEATPERVPWSGPWWPFTGNGVSGPIGKYDAATCNKYDSQGWELKYHGAGVKGVQGWWGHCNGWSVAAALYDEPSQPVTVNGVEFSISDIKGLLSEAAMSVHADFFGDRVDWHSGNSPVYDDTVPGQYFLVLTNHMGKFRHPVLLDVYTGAQVWNQPMAGYRFEYPKPEDYLGASSEAPNIHRIKLTTTFWWTLGFETGDGMTPQFQFENSDPTYFQSRTVTMELWLDGPVEFDANGRVVSSGDVVVFRENDYYVGGKWTYAEGGYSEEGHPDYLWVPYTVVAMEPGGEHQDFVNPYVDIHWIENNLIYGTPTESCSSPGTPRSTPDRPRDSESRPNNPNDRANDRNTPANPPAGDFGNSGNSPGNTPPVSDIPVNDTPRNDVSAGGDSLSLQRESR